LYLPLLVFAVAAASLFCTDGEMIELIQGKSESTLNAAGTYGRGIAARLGRLALQARGATLGSKQRQTATQIVSQNSSPKRDYVIFRVTQEEIAQKKNICKLLTETTISYEGTSKHLQTTFPLALALGSAELQICYNC
jgi:hypothetical protein